MTMTVVSQIGPALGIIWTELLDAINRCVCVIQTFVDGVPRQDKPVRLS